MKGNAKTVAFCLFVASFQTHFSVTLACMTCPLSWARFENHCYLVVTEPKTFDEAEAHCQRLSRFGRLSHLTSIKSQEEHNFLIELIAATYGQHERVWFGYHLDRASGSFYWVDGSQHGPGNYTNWSPGEPSNEFGGEECVEIYHNVLWNDMPCNYVKGFACKIPDRISAKL